MLMAGGYATSLIHTNATTTRNYYERLTLGRRVGYVRNMGGIPSPVSLCPAKILFPNIPHDYGSSNPPSQVSRDNNIHHGT